MSLLSINDYAIGRDYSNNIDDTNCCFVVELLTKDNQSNFKQIEYITLISCSSLQTQS